MAVTFCVDCPFSLWIWASPGAAMLVLTKKSRWRLDNAVFDSDSFVNDFTDTDWWAQFGSTHGHVFATFKHCF